MTQKDYILLAAALREQRPIGQEDCKLACLVQWERDVDAIAEALEQDNPRFDRDKFLDACGYEVE